jgi:hypothetical protein
MAFNKRLRQIASILRSQGHINTQMAADKKIRTRDTSGAKTPQTKAKCRKLPEESSQREDDIYDGNACCACWENQFKTTSKSD